MVCAQHNDKVDAMHQCNPLTLILPLLLFSTACGGGGVSNESPATPSPPGSCTSGGVSEGPALVIDRITFSQAVDIPLFEGGRLVQSPNAPVVAERAGQLRVFVHGSSGWQNRQVYARLFVKKPSGLEDQQGLYRLIKGQTGSYASLPSTFNFDLSEAQVQVGTRVRLELVEATGCEIPVQQNPTATGLSLGAQTSPRMEVVLVPLNMQGAPTTVSESTRRAYREALLATYPIAPSKFQVRVHPTPISIDKPLADESWGAMLHALLKRRADDEVARYVFYFGVVDTPAGYCVGSATGCIAGLSYRPSGPKSAWHGAVGWNHSYHTCQHELGHALGRGHAPCKVSSLLDKDFPYAGGKIGRWGTKVSSGRLYSPSAPDFMGYCEDSWISDHNYRHIFERLIAIQSAQALSVDADSWLRVGQYGSELSWETPVPGETPEGTELALSFWNRDGEHLGDGVGYRARFADLDDASTIFIPKAPDGAAWVELDGFGVLAF